MSCKFRWRILRLTYPWLPLAIALWRIITATDTCRLRARLRFWKLYSRIDFANLLAIAHDMIQPEYWLL
ncbi:hypothetical protein H6F67_04115 [Microcoleus sp. FACHB-1515]|uniref:hypothetical protein n=1 Tax=Cyanophyceae TaxID=3028117 RepID=UPI0016824DD5|nr:hypothetical protein [Microcoleus sp. FACHB-1515]MBD2089039.1 hypothetical protein [Microcoleus sp. FACHB-1515]